MFIKNYHHSLKTRGLVIADMLEISGHGCNRPRPVDVITARALAPVDRLLNLLTRQFDRPVRCLFLKGKSVHDELGCLDIRPDITWSLHPSLTNSEAFVLDLLVEPEKRCATP